MGAITKLQGLQRACKGIYRWLTVGEDELVRTIRDFVAYLWQVVRDGIFIAAALADAITFVIKSFVQPARKPAILDEPSAYLALLTIGFVTSAYRIHQSLKAQLSSMRAQLATERDKLVRELKKELIDLKFTIERRSKDPIPIDKALRIEDIARELEDEYIIAECREMMTILQRNYEGVYNILGMFEQDRKGYDSVRTRVDFILRHLDS